jgi:uncharacterized protein YutE (UPF0331/DUF86 family)
MVDKDVFWRKADNLEKHLSLIRERNKIGFDEFLANDVLQDALLFQLQLAIQTCIDLAAHIVSDEGLGAPAGSSELFYLLNDAGIIDLPMTEQMVRAVGFRNLIAHEYGKIEMTIAYRAVTENFLSLGRFLHAVGRHFGFTIGD